MTNKSLEIVCIDDEPEILEFYKSILEQTHQWPVVTFQSSVEAKSYIERKFDNIGAIICDYKMPDLDGLALLKEISLHFGNIPFLLISGYVDAKLLAEFGSQISAFIEKPIDVNAVLAAVTKIVSKTKDDNIKKMENGREFAEEAIPKVSELENLLLQLEQAPTDIENIQAVYRILHTLKGTAACVGLAYLAIFNHSFESRLMPIRDAKEVLTPELTTSLLAAQAHLMQYFLKLAKGELMELTSFEDFLENPSSGHQLETEKLHASKINVDVTTLNDFLEGVGELTILRNLLLQRIEALGYRLRENQEEWRFLVNILAEMHKTQSSMQKAATELLKVQFGSLLPSLRRNVRDLCIKLGKKMRIEVTGETILFDHNALQALSDSMLHLLRNSVDHGVENPLEREAKGKPAEGCISIKIIEVGEKTIISIADDGKGINPTVIAQKAIEKNLKTQDQIGNMSAQQINALIFESGFSTAEAVTEVSGRGVGMDMVKKSIEAIGGSVSLFSEWGQGTTFEIQIPKNQSLRIIKTIIVNSRNIDKLTIPTEEVIIIESAATVIRESRVLQRNGRTHVLYSGEFICALELSEISEKAVIILLQKENQKYAVVVDNVESSEETVLRELDGYAVKMGLFDKAAISGRHGTLLFLDIATVNKLIGNQSEQRAG